MLQQLLIMVLKGEGEQFLPSTLWHSQLLGLHPYCKGWCHFLWRIQLFPQYKHSLLSCISHTHTHWFLLCLSQTKPTET